MKHVVRILALSLLITACASTPEDIGQIDHIPSQSRVYRPPERLPAPVDPKVFWQGKLGMNRAASDLGYAERRFNPCDQGVQSASGCEPQYMTVIHFQLLCRDSVGTVQEAPTSMQPLSAPRVNWQIGGITGDTSTDARGYGQLVMFSSNSTSGKRLTLRIGKQFLGFTASDMTRVVLPRNFCGKA